MKSQLFFSMQHRHLAEDREILSISGVKFAISLRFLACRLICLFEENGIYTNSFVYFLIRWMTSCCTLTLSKMGNTGLKTLFLCLGWRYVVSLLRWCFRWYWTSVIRVFSWTLHLFLILWLIFRWANLSSTTCWTVLGSRCLTSPLHSQPGEIYTVKTMNE